MNKEIKRENFKVEPIDGCLHLHHFVFAPKNLPILVKACTKCGSTSVIADGQIIYETYLSTPILVGFGAQLVNLVNEFFGGKKS